MKTIIFLLISAISFYSLANRIDIIDAINKNQVNAKTYFHNLDEKGMEITVKNLTNKALTVSFPSGLFFDPEDEEYQPLLNIEEEILVLKANETKSIRIGAYCMDYTKSMPYETTFFKFKQTTDPNIIALLDKLNTLKPSKQNYQDAVWAMLNKSPLSYVAVSSPADEELKKFLSEKTGLEIPWYTNEYERIATHGEPIVQKAFALSGQLSVKSDVDIDFEMVIIDLSDNSVRREFPGGGTIMKGWDNTFNFSLEVSAWPVGEYEVVLRNKTNAEKIKGFPFEIS